MIDEETTIGFPEVGTGRTVAMITAGNVAPL